MDRLSDKKRKHTQRKGRIRKRILGTIERPRLMVFKSHKNISVQAIDDVAGRTMASVSTLEKDMADTKRSMGDAKTVGRKIAERLNAIKVKRVVFDRNGYRYHGIVKALADEAREAGLEF